MSDDRPPLPKRRLNPQEIAVVPARVASQIAGPVMWEGSDQKTSPHAIPIPPMKMTETDDRISRLSKQVPVLGQELAELRSSQRSLEDGHQELKAGQREHAGAIAEVRVAVATVVGGHTALFSTMAADRLERERVFAADREERNRRALEAADLTKIRIAASPRFWKTVITAVAAGIAIIVTAIIAHGCS